MAKKSSFCNVLSIRKSFFILCLLLVLAMTLKPFQRKLGFSIPRQIEHSGGDELDSRGPMSQLIGRLVGQCSGYWLGHWVSLWSFGLPIGESMVRCFQRDDCGETGSI